VADDRHVVPAGRPLRRLDTDDAPSTRLLDHQRAVVAPHRLRAHFADLAAELVAARAALPDAPAVLSPRAAGLGEAAKPPIRLHDVVVERDTLSRGRPFAAPLGLPLEPVVAPLAAVGDEVPPVVEDERAAGRCPLDVRYAHRRRYGVAVRIVRSVPRGEAIAWRGVWFAVLTAT
jgi:hypothetical protein